MFVKKMVLSSVPLLTLSLLGSLAQAQCQNQDCSSDGACYKCEKFSGHYCSVKGRCPRECTQGFCDYSGVLGASGLDACLQTRPNKALPTSGTAIGAAFQQNSPAVIEELTTKLENKNGRSFVTVKRLTVYNKSNANVTQFRIGWIVTSQTGKTVHLHSQALPTTIAGHSKYQFVDHLTPLVPYDKSTKSVRFFLTEVSSDDGQFFTEEADKLTE